jgi:hypothetical protein
MPTNVLRLPNHGRRTAARNENRRKGLVLRPHKVTLQLRSGRARTANPIEADADHDRYVKRLLPRHAGYSWSTAGLRNGRSSPRATISGIAK